MTCMGSFLILYCRFDLCVFSIVYMNWRLHVAYTNLRLPSQELQLFFSWPRTIIIVNWKGDFTFE